MQKILYSYAEAAGLLGLPSPQALRDLVYKNRGPIQTRIGARVLFAYTDLLVWASAHRDITPMPTSAGAETTAPGKRCRGRPSVADHQRLTVGGST